MLLSSMIADWASVFTSAPPAYDGVTGDEWFDRATMTFFFLSLAFEVLDHIICATSEEHSAGSNVRALRAGGEILLEIVI
jgi:hypothetical protein